MNARTSGKCLCGAVTYEVVGPPVVVAQCHCQECRRLSGTGHTVGAMFRSGQITLNGQLAEFKYESEAGSKVTKAFCVNCGSPIYGSNTRLPDHMTLTLGTMDEARELSVEVVIFARNRPHWDRVDDDVTSFETQPDWKPGTD